MPVTTDNLISAAKLLRFMYGGEITAIQFEDGSGKKFNFQINGGQWQFIDLSVIMPTKVGSGRKP